MDNRRRQVTYEPVSIMKFDPHNPRIPAQIDRENEQAVLEYMIRKANVAELMGSIGEVGFFPGEPLLVVGSGTDGALTVVEGNRRLAAVKLLLQPDLAPIRAKTIAHISEEAKNKDELVELPVLVFNDRNQILQYLGYRHITGVQSWGPLAKAEYLKQLLQLNEEEDPHEQEVVLAKEIGSRADYVGRLLASLAVYERLNERSFFHIEGLDPVTIEFSVLSTALSYRNIADFVGLENPRDRILNTLDDARLEELITWMFEKDAEGRTVLGESRNLSRLNVVVADPIALAALRSGQPLEDVYLLTQGPINSFLKAVDTAKLHLRSAKHFLQLANRVTAQEASLLEELIVVAGELKALANGKLTQS